MDHATFNGFKVLAPDPPWQELGGGKIKRGAQAKYPCLSTDDIIDVLRSAPTWIPDRSGALMWCWTTSNFLDDGIRVVGALGFRYVTHWTWAKVERYVLTPELRALFETTYGHAPEEVYTPPRKPGLGQRSRQEHEHLLLGVMGSVPVPEPGFRPRSVIYAPRGAHSVKPPEAYELIERSSPPGPRLEFFGRAPRRGWVVDGNEVDWRETFDLG